MSLIVNGEKIYPEFIEQEMTVLRPKYQQTFQDQSVEQQEKQLREWAKENIIEKTLLFQTAMKDPKPVEQHIIEMEYKNLLEGFAGEKNFLDKNGLTQKDIGKVKKDIEQQFRIKRLIEKLQNQIDNISEKEARDFYDQNQAYFNIPEQIRAAHIVVHTDNHTPVDTAKIKIYEAQKKLKKGHSFEELADSYSDCPGNGGDLGDFVRGQMVQEFEDVVFSMQPHQISDVFQTEFGFHIAKVYARIPEGIADFAQVRNYL
jgi:parvulin-like peptidyl-prolyl isomerase